jgi:hypothetical protein
MTDRGRVVALAPAAVLALTAIVLIVLGRRESIGYDSYWHIFIARQDLWPNFWREVRDNAHPPLFYFLLRLASLWIGPTYLAYRAVSIAATVASAALVAAIVWRTTTNRALAVVAVAAFGFAYGAIMIGLEVRAYALSTAFTLLAFMFYLDWLRAPARRVTLRTPIGFALAATAAVLTHYSTFFFLAAAIATPVALAIVSSRWRRRLVATIAARPWPTVAMFAVPIVVAVAAYVIHVALWGGGRLNHVPEFMFNPATERPWWFVVRNTVNLAAIVLPGGSEFVSGLYTAAQVIALAVIGGTALAGLLQLGRAKTPRFAAVPIVVTAVMVVLNAVGGLTYRYPYGGVARHEFFLVPFVVVSLFSLIEVVRRGAPPRLRGRTAWTALAALGVAASVASWTWTFQLHPDPLFPATMTGFHERIPAPKAVLLDQFSFINFFSHYHDWEWRAGDDWPGEAVRQGWRITKGDATIALCRNTQWSLDMTSALTYDAVVECGQRTGADRVAIFRTHWWDAPASIAAFDAGLAASDRLTPIVMERDGDNVIAEFGIDPAVLSDCSGAPPAPTDLHVVSNSGRVVVLEWAPVHDSRASYVVEAGFAPGASDALNTAIGRTTTFTAKGVNPASYYVRVKAKTLCGVSAPSPEIIVNVAP